MSDTVQGTAAWHRRVLPALLLVAFVVLGLVYRDTLVSITNKWYDDAAFSHGYLILPIALWLAWRKRAALAVAPLRPSWLGVAVLGGCAAVWIVTRGTGVLVLEQFAVVAMVPALVLAMLGGPIARTLAFPLAFLFFAVPFGRGIVPDLMQFTADLATAALQWSGIPVYRSHMYITIPAGNFEVARACSGLNYVITGLVLGALYAHLTYHRWTKRLLCMVAFLVVPIVANGLRVYFTILVAHLTDMRYGPGMEHVTFGRIFFIVVMLAMFWVGRRWHDDSPTTETSPHQATTAQRLPVRAWVPAVVAILVLLLAPAHLNSTKARASARLVAETGIAALPSGQGNWTGPAADIGGWQPGYTGAVTQRHGVYTDRDGRSVEVFVAVYGLGKTVGEEMISYGNVLYEGEHGSLAETVRHRVSLADGAALEVREVIVPLEGSPRLVWHWFMVGDRPATSEFLVKALEARAFVMRGADSERVITLSTPYDDAARQRLQSFVDAHAACIAGGLDAEACGG